MAKLRDHPDWPRRIMQAVRKAAICLKMTREQLLLSWNEPYQKTSGFILGFGDVEIYFYRQADPIAVILKNGEIVGWSEKSK